MEERRRAGEGKKDYISTWITCPEHMVICNYGTSSYKNVLVRTAVLSEVCEKKQHTIDN